MASKWSLNHEASFTYDEFQGIYDPNGSVSQGVEAINEGVGVIITLVMQVQLVGEMARL